MQMSIPKAALVTGSAKRLGRAIAEDLASHGFAIALHANTSIDECEALAASDTESQRSRRTLQIFQRPHR